MVFKYRTFQIRDMFLVMITEVKSAEHDQDKSKL